MLFTTVKLTRKELYEEIWKISAAGVAKKYGIPYAKCLAQIKAAKIPIPPSGYWTKISYGKPVEQTPLQGDEDEIVALSAEELRQYHTLEARELEDPPLPLSPQEGTVLSLSDTFSLAEPAEQNPSGDDASKPTDVPPETVQRLGQTYNVYDRETLYKEVWAMPVTEVAKRYHVSDVALHKVCKSLDIPTPPQGYWAKLRAGKPVKCLPLPPGDKKTKLGIRTTISHRGDNQGNSTPLDFLTEEERQVVLSVAAQILMPRERARMLPEILAHRKRIAEWAKRKRQQEREFGANWNRGRKEVPPPFAEGISAEQQLRVLRLIDALSKAMKPLGWNLTSDLQLAMGQEVVTLTFSEATDRVPHTPTKEENLELLKYEEDRKNHLWASKPQIRKYDAVYNGRLSVSINGARTFRDCGSYVLEDRLGDMMLAIYEEAEQLKQARLVREEADSYPRSGLYLYASTEEILASALEKMRFRLEKPKRMEVSCGDILQIDPGGAVTQSSFDTAHFWWNDPPLFYHPYISCAYTPKSEFEREYLEEVKSVAASFGYSPEDIDRILEQGFTLDDVEDLLYCGHCR